MAVEWLEAPERLINIAKELIEKYHQDLVEARIGFVMRSEAQESNGKYVAGKAAKISKKYAPLLSDQDLDFIIWIAKDVWDRSGSDKARALVDHELCHCYMLGDEPKLRHHDFEDFGVIIDRYGLWTIDLMHLKPTFEKAIQQVTQIDMFESKDGKPIEGGMVVRIDPSRMPAE